jgi:hypothetical protein
MTVVVLLSIIAIGCDSSARSIVGDHYNWDSNYFNQDGIENCHGYTWWKLTGELQRSKSIGDLKTELTRRGYRPFLYSEGISLNQGDVLTFEGDIGHSGIVIYDGKLSHFRKTEIQEIQIQTGNYPRYTIFLYQELRRLAY